MKKQNKEIEIPDNPAIFIDQKTGARTMTIPFRLPDSTAAVLMICRLMNEDWKPSKEIKSITINYK